MFLQGQCHEILLTFLFGHETLPTVCTVHRPVMNKQNDFAKFVHRYLQNLRIGEVIYYADKVSA